MTSPLFSVIVPVYNTPHGVLREMANSVLNQIYDDWELLLINDKSSDPNLSSVLDEIAAQDMRVRVIHRAENGGIVAASNTGVAEAKGKFIALLDHDDLLTTNALKRVAWVIDSDNDEIDYIYSDEDKIDTDGNYYDQFDKPDWSPERLRGHMYTCHLSVLRTSLVGEVGGFHEGFDGSHYHDLVLRVTEKARAIRHIPEVLYHWRAITGSTALDTESKDYAWDASVRAVQAHIDRVGIAATAVHSEARGICKLEREPELVRSTSIIIPTRGSQGEVFGAERVFVTEAVRSVLSHTQHKNLELVVVYDHDTPKNVLKDLRIISEDRLKLVPFEGEFNFSRKCNLGALAAKGEVLVFLNDDIEARSDEVIGNLIAPLSESDVGITGAKLFFEDGTLQHAGHLHSDGGYNHYYLGENSSSKGRFGSLVVNREVSGLTAACIAVPREVFFDVGGFTESLPGNFNDVDFSLKVRMTGRRLVWLHDVELLHFESKTRDRAVHKFEIDFMHSRWGKPVRDPYPA